MLRLVLLAIGASMIFAQNESDPNGYIMFCPCMGRFGNQAEQFLGVMSFAKTLNRTLILPHWIEYPPYSATSNQIPFDRYFQVEAMREYHRVILMKDFMVNLADDIWPKGKRSVFCYTAQVNDESKNESCHAKDGNPFGPFWSHFHIDFDNDIFYRPLYFDIRTPDAWNARFPASEYPVLAFSGAPGSFPALPQHIPLMKHLVYTDYIRNQAEAFLKKNQIVAESLLAIHLRNGPDFERACGYVNEKSNFFASGQCLGYRLEKGLQLTKEICYPSKDQILEQTGKFFEKTPVTALFVAADGDSMIDEFQKRLQIKVLQYKRPSSQSEGEAAHVDLSILSLAKYAIVNCPSTFSAFAKRQRDVQGKPTDFWGVENERTATNELNADL